MLSTCVLTQSLRCFPLRSVIYNTKPWIKLESHITAPVILKWFILQNFLQKDAVLRMRNSIDVVDRVVSDFVVRLPPRTPVLHKLLLKFKLVRSYSSGHTDRRTYNISNPPGGKSFSSFWRVRFRWVPGGTEECEGIHTAHGTSCHVTSRARYETRPNARFEISCLSLLTLHSTLYSSGSVRNSNPPWQQNILVIDCRHENRNAASGEPSTSNADVLSIKMSSK